VLFYHACPDWDYLWICAEDAEFAVCACDLGPEAQEIREALSTQQNAFNDAGDVVCSS
jgi:hypothetical protein